MTRTVPPGAVATAQMVGARDQQEDSLVVHAPVADTGPRAGEVLLVLADGMGGHAGGEIASRLVVERFSSACRDSAAGVMETMRASLDLANEAVAMAVAEAPRLNGMGATLVACMVRQDSLYWISVGDSPLWVCRGGALQRLNADHSMVPLLEAMVSRGELTRDEMLTDPRRNQLRSVVTGYEIALVDLCDQPFRLETGDIVVLASDGIETLPEIELAALLQAAGGMLLDELAGKLLAGVKAAGRPYQDNASVILYRS